MKKKSQIKKDSQVTEGFDLALKNFGIKNGYLIPYLVYLLKSPN